MIIPNTKVINVKYPDSETIAVMVNGNDPDRFITVRWNDEHDTMIVAYVTPEAKTDVREVKIPDEVSLDMLTKMLQSVIEWAHREFLAPTKGVN